MRHGRVHAFEDDREAGSCRHRHAVGVERRVHRRQVQRGAVGNARRRRRGGRARGGARSLTRSRRSLSRRGRRRDATRERIAHHRVADGRVGSVRVDLDEPDGAEPGVGERVRDERVQPGVGDVQLEHRAVARRDVVGLQAVEGVRRIPGWIGQVEHRPDHVERVRQGGAGVHHPDPEWLVRSDLERCRLVLIRDAVEHDVLRVDREHAVQIAFVQTVDRLGAGIELARDQDELPLRRQVIGLDDDRAVHPVGDVLQDGRDAAVVHEDAGEHRDPIERPGVPRVDGLIVAVERRLPRVRKIGPRRHRRVEIDRVLHPDRAGVREGEMDRVAEMDADHGGRRGPVERPHVVPDARCDLLDGLLRGQVDVHPRAVGRVGPVDDRLRTAGDLVGSRRRPHPCDADHQRDRQEEHPDRHDLPHQLLLLDGCAVPRSMCICVASD